MMDPKILMYQAAIDHVRHKETIGKLAYPVDPFYTWNQVEDAAGLNHFQLMKTHNFEAAQDFEVYSGPMPASENATAHFRDIKAMQRPVIFDTPTKRGGGTVVFGEKIFAFTPPSHYRTAI